MNSNRITVAGLAFCVAIGSGTQVAADTGSFAGGLFGAIIGQAIVNDANNKRRRSVVSSAVRVERRETQSALNYFGFPAGQVDGIFGRKTRLAVSGYQAHMGYQPTGNLLPYEKDFLLTSYRQAMAGGFATNQLIAANPLGAKGLLFVYRDELIGVTPASRASQNADTSLVVNNTEESVLPDFLAATLPFHWRHSAIKSAC